MDLITQNRLSTKKGKDERPREEEGTETSREKYRRSDKDKQECGC